MEPQPPTKAEEIEAMRLWLLALVSVLELMPVVLASS